MTNLKKLEIIGYRFWMVLNEEMMQLGVAHGL